MTATTCQTAELARAGWHAGVGMGAQRPIAPPSAEYVRAAICSSVPRLAVTFYEGHEAKLRMKESEVFIMWERPITL